MRESMAPKFFRSEIGAALRSLGLTFLQSAFDSLVPAIPVFPVVAFAFDSRVLRSASGAGLRSHDPTFGFRE